MVSLMSASRYVTLASHYESRPSMYILGLNSAKIVEVAFIRVDTICDGQSDGKTCAWGKQYAPTLTVLFTLA